MILAEMKRRTEPLVTEYRQTEIQIGIADLTQYKWPAIIKIGQNLYRSGGKNILFSDNNINLWLPYLR
jgi:hypothetical protein